MKNNRKTTLQAGFLLFLVIGTVMIIRHQHIMPYQHDTGLVFGTVYNITYQSDSSLHKDIKEELQKVDNSLSIFNKSSVISRINRNENVYPDEMFLEIFDLAQRVSDDTDGAFDITVAPLVNTWGFGFKKGIEPTAHTIDSIRQFIGHKKVSCITVQGKKTIKKADPRIMLDCGAIAKGYGCDAIAKLMRRKGVENFMIEIGGEIVTKGVNSKRVPWKIGITKPADDSLNVNNEMQAVINVTDKAMATSGNYRNFYYRDGKKYAHTIDPATGYPVQHSILSATVLAGNCATADAYATSFMVMGLERAKAVLDRHPELMAYLIYTGQDGKYNVWYSPSMKDKIQQ